MSTHAPAQHVVPSLHGALAPPQLATHVPPAQTRLLPQLVPSCRVSFLHLPPWQTACSQALSGLRQSPLLLQFFLPRLPPLPPLPPPPPFLSEWARRVPWRRGLA